MEKDRGKHFNTYEEAAEWFNSHDMTDFEDQYIGQPNAYRKIARIETTLTKLSTDSVALSSASPPIGGLPLSFFFPN